MRVTVRVRPGASRTYVGGRYGTDEEAPVLVVRVGERAVDGAATHAVVKAVADAFGVRRTDVTVVAGERSRTKILEIDAAAAEREGLAARLSELLGT